MSTPNRRPPRADNRLPQVLDAAAAQFAARGFEAASIRDIVGAVGMLPGSLYYHFATKDELLAAVYAEGVRRVEAAVLAALEGCGGDPWERLEAACTAHLETLLGQGDYARVVISVAPRDVPSRAEEIAAQRSRYEGHFRALVDALPLPGGWSQGALRLMLLGALNWVPTWHRADGGASPREIARGFVHMLREPAAQGAAAGRHP